MMTPTIWIALGGFMLTLLVQTAVIFRWGARLQLLVEQHEGQINGPEGLRRWKHDNAAPKLTVLWLDYEERKEADA